MSQLENLNRLKQSLRERLAQSVESMTGNPARVSQGEDVTTLREDGLTNATIWAAQYVTGGIGKLTFVADEAAWKTIGSKVLEAAGLEDQDENTVRSTYLEILAQAASSWAQDLTATHGRKWEFGESGPSSFPLDQSVGWNVQVDPGGGPVTIYIFGTAALFERPVAAAPAENDYRQVAVDKQSPESTAQFDLLLDVELPVSISFGRALVPLKEILKLNSGSIVELNRAVTEPVEVIVNNCVIARGEVVVVEGNYGVRIEQIISRQDRLRTMN